jgi:hypothetical protein
MLSKEQQELIIQRLEKSSLRQVSQELEGLGIKATFATLSKFRRWYLTRSEAQFVRMREMIGQMEALRAAAEPGASPVVDEEKMFQLAHQALSTQAFMDQDFDGFARMYKVWLERRRADLEKRKAERTKG